MREAVWTCRDGRQLLLSRMETQHVRNCIAVIQHLDGRGVLRVLLARASGYMRGRGRVCWVLYKREEKLSLRTRTEAALSALRYKQPTPSSLPSSPSQGGNTDATMTRP